MPSAAPETLESLLRASMSAERQLAWEAFLRQYSALILHAIRHFGGDHDLVLDRYAYAIDVLQRDNFRRLRAFVTTGRGRFTTWLVAVVRRLCVDQHRARYGRPQTDAGRAWVTERRNLTDLVSDELALERLPSPEPAIDRKLLHEELYAALQRSLARLAPIDRLILRLRFEDDVSVPEIARLLDYGSPFGLYREIDKILATLRRDLEAVGFKGLAS